MITEEFGKVVESLCSEETPLRPTNEIKDLVTSLSLFLWSYVVWYVYLKQDLSRQDKTLIPACLADSSPP